MMATGAARFPIRFDPWYRILSSALFLRPQSSYIEIDGDEVQVQMGWAFRARFPRASVAKTSRLDSSPLSRGVHGYGGRWLVNGAGDRVLVVELEPPSRARFLGLPVRLRQLMVSVDDVEAVAARLRSAS
jgi:hypothetical protein